MSAAEHDHWAQMLGYSIAQNVTNQNYMSGLTLFVNMVQDPGRYGESYSEQMASTIVPAFIGQTAAGIDPFLRETYTLKDAVLARLPGLRKGLLPKRDLFGEPMPAPEHLWTGSPFSVSVDCKDPVRLEAARLRFAAPITPKKLDVLPGIKGLQDMLTLTPDQRDIYASTAGTFAHEALEKLIAQPT